MPEMGPLITKNTAIGCSAYVAKGIEEGAEALTDGRDVDRDRP